MNILFYAQTCSSCKLNDHIAALEVTVNELHMGEWKTTFKDSETFRRRGILYLF